MKLKYFVVLFFAFFAALIHASESLKPDEAIALAALDGYAQGVTDAGQFAGVVLIARDGKILFEKAYGLRDENTEQLNTINTQFNLASAGKMFTAVAVLQQIAQGRLNLDTKVGEVLTDYPNKIFADNVTIRQLLTHTAGAGDIDLFEVGNSVNREKVKSVSDMVALHSTRAPAFKPGTEQAYGNFGHVVLGRIVEVLSGDDFESYLSKNIFIPAGMQHTVFVNCESYTDDMAVGYVTVGDKQQLNCATLPKRGFPAGGQVSTAKDMLLFVQALKAGKILPVALFAEAIKTQREFMGLGFFATGYGPGWPAREFRWGHGGNADGICTDVRTYPTTGSTYIVLSNRDAPACFAVSNFLHKQLKP